MNQNKPTSIVNNLHSHASLLLSASPTIINSPLQASVAKSSSLVDDDLPGDDINFKKPQNEIFKKIDGKIQKIVAAHSNLNKLYALNDFPSVLGPKKPFELPPQLPRPPPWVPKVSNDGSCSQWNDSSLLLNNSAPNLELPEFRRNTDSLSSNRVTKITSRHEIKCESQSIPKPPTITIDSAISKLHQRRLQQFLDNQQKHTPPRTSAPDPQKPIHIEAHLARQLFTSSSMRPNEQARLIQQNKPMTSSLSNLQRLKSSGSTSISIGSNLTDEQKRKFQMQLIDMFRQEIAAVTKLAKIKFGTPPPPEQLQTAQKKSLLLKKSPQSLFNTIRRETSLLLNRSNPNNRSGSSLLIENNNRIRPIQASVGTTNHRQQFTRYQSIKVVVPPVEYFKHTCAKSGNKEGSDNENCNCSESKSEVLDIDRWCPSKKYTIKYRTLQLKLYQLKAGIVTTRNSSIGAKIDSLDPSQQLKRRSPQKSLDKIVDRLQARCLSSVNSAVVIQETNRLLQGSSVSPNPSQISYETTPSPPSSPKPIPVFRSSPLKGSQSTSTNSGNSRNINHRSKKAKRLHHFGLKFGNYLEKESPQLSVDRISVEQFAKCLDLVRSNDAILQRHQEKLLHSESKWRVPISDRPLRLRRIRGERFHMPASASYKATRKVGLQ